VVIIMLSLLVPTIAGFWLAHHKRLQIARHIPPILFFALGLYLSYIIPLGMTPFIFFILAATLASMLHEERAYWLIAGLSLTAYFTVGIGRSQESIQIIIEIITIAGGTFTGIALLQRFSIRQFQRSTLKAYKNREELDIAYQKLYESKRELQAMINASPDIIHLLDSNGIILSSNSGYAKKLGIEVDDVIGKNVFDYVATEETKRSRKAAVDKVFRTGKPLQLEDKELSSVFELHIHPVFNPAGEVTAVAVFAHDITESKKTREELEKYRDHLEEMVKERTNELEEKNAELERFNELFIGREFRIKELRDKIMELEKKLVKQKN